MRDAKRELIGVCLRRRRVVVVLDRGRPRDVRFGNEGQIASRNRADAIGWDLIVRKRLTGRRINHGHAQSRKISRPQGVRRHRRQLIKQVPIASACHAQIPRRPVRAVVDVRNLQTATKRGRDTLIEVGGLGRRTCRVQRIGLSVEYRSAELVRRVHLQPVGAADATAKSESAAGAAGTTTSSASTADAANLSCKRRRARGAARAELLAVGKPELSAVERGNPIGKLAAIRLDERAAHGDRVFTAGVG